MNKSALLSFARSAAARVPAVLPHLDLPTRYRLAAPVAVKTTEYFDATLRQAVQHLYNGTIGGEFVDILGGLIRGQIRQAYETAWSEYDDNDPLPDYLTGALSDAQDASANFDFIYNYYTDIVDARVDHTPIDPLLARVPGWAHIYDTAYKEAKRLIDTESGGNLIWRKGNTENGCSTCSRLNGIVMSAREWETLDVHPQGYPNPKLECGGGGPVNNCDCTLEPTDKRRSPKAFESVMNITGG